MKINRIRIAPVELPLVSPLMTARGTINARTVIVVAVQNEDGATGLGEAAPLPEFGTESGATAAEILSSLADRSTFPGLEPRLEALDEWLAVVGLAYRTVPATAWALECALASLVAREQEQTLAHVLGTKSQSVPVSALVGGRTPAATLEAAAQAVAAGFRTVKLKVGARHLRSDIELVRKLREAWPEIVLRADANLAWQRDEARQFCHAVTSSGLEYIEDPLRKPTAVNLRELRSASGIPIALDEPLRDDGVFEEALRENLCDAVVLKPAAIGSFARLAGMARAARARQMGVVISNLIESSLGLGYAALCAAAYGSAGLAHGLGTRDLLTADTLTLSLSPRQGHLALPDTREFETALTPELRQQLEILP